MEKLKIALIVGIVGFVCLMGQNNVAASPDISGSYRCTVYNPFLKVTYDAPLTVVRYQDTYKFKWIIDGKTFFGTGIFSNQADDIIAVGEFWLPMKEDNTGIAVYRVEKDGTLNGNWAVTNKELIGTEVCKKI